MTFKYQSASEENQIDAKNSGWSFKIILRG